MGLSRNDYIKEKEEMTVENEFIIIRYTYPRLNKVKKINPEFYEEIKDKIGIELRITKIEINEKTTEYLYPNNILQSDTKYVIFWKKKNKIA